MAWFTKKEWKNRLAEFAGRRTLTDVATGASQVVDVARNEGTISQEGDAFSAANMNEFEQRILEGFTQAEKATTELNQKIGADPVLIKTITSFSDTFKTIGVDWTQYKKLYFMTKMDYLPTTDAGNTIFAFTIPTAIIEKNVEYAILPYTEAYIQNTSHNVEVHAKFSSNNISMYGVADGGTWKLMNCKIYGE